MSRPMVQLQVSTCLYRRRNGHLEFLIVQRSPDHHAFPCMWEFGGGAVEVGETLREAADREAGEELGASDLPWHRTCTTYHYESGGTIVHGVRMYAEIGLSAWRPALSWEHVAHQWVTAIQLSDMGSAVIPGLAADAALICGKPREAVPA